MDLNNLPDKSATPSGVARENVGSSLDFLPDTNADTLRSLYRQQTVKPDDFANARKLSRTTGLPMPTVQNNPAKAADLANEPDWSTLEQLSPKAAAELVKNTDLFNLSKDDTGNLASWERGLDFSKKADQALAVQRMPGKQDDSMGAAFKRGITALGVFGDAAALKVDELLTSIGTTFLPEPKKGPMGLAPSGPVDASNQTAKSSLTDVANLYASLPRDKRLDIAGKIYEQAYNNDKGVNGAIDALGYIVRNPDAAVNFMIEMGVQAAPFAPIGGVAGGAVGDAIATRIASQKFAQYIAGATTMAGVNFTGNYGPTLAGEIAQKIAEGQPFEAAWEYASTKALTEGGVNAAFAFIPVPGGGKGASFASKVGNIAGEVVKQGTAGATGAAAAAAAVGETASPAELFLEAVGEGFGAPTDVAWAAVTSGARKLTSDAAKVRDSQEQFAKLTQIVQLATASKLRERAPDTFAQFVQSVADQTEGALTEVYIDARTLVETLDQSGFDVIEFMGRVPSVADNLQRASEAGESIAIPIGEFTGHVVGTGLETALLPHLRATEDGLSQIEAQQASELAGEYLQQMAKTVVAEASDATAVAASAEVVKGKVLEQLTAGGRFTADVNDGYASLVRDFYTVMSERTGMTPEQMYERYPLTVRAEGVSLEAGQYDQYDQTGQLRTGTPEFAAWFGNSQITNADGTPKRMYHGTAQDISVFRAKQAGAIFVTEDPSFAEDFSEMSKDWMVENYEELLSEDKIAIALDNAEAGIRSKLANEDPDKVDVLVHRMRMRETVLNAVVRSEFTKALADQMASGPNIMPLYVSAQNPFDYDNPEHIAAVVAELNKNTNSWGEPRGDKSKPYLESGNWEEIEKPTTQAAIKAAGFDGFYVKEARKKNLAIYNPNQVKSVFNTAPTMGPDVMNQSYAQQVQNLEQAITDAGGEVQDVMQIDQLIDSKDVPIITLQDMLGFDVFPTIADRTAAAALYTGIDASGVSVAIPLLGGPLFPLRESNVQAGIVWANRGKGVIAQKAAKLKAGANYMLVVMGDANMHQSNSTVAAAFMATLEAWARDGRISPENVKALGDLVRTTGEKMEGAGAKASKVKEYLTYFPGFDDHDTMHTYMDGISFDARKRVLEIMASKQALELGAPPMNRILDATREPSLAGHRWGDGVLLVEVDQESPQVELGTQGTTAHPDFPVGVRGKVVGKLEAAINWQLLWQDWLAENSDKDSPRRAFELSKPIVKVTQDLIDRIGPIKQDNIESARQARLAADFAADNWSTSDDAVKQGGVSPQEFLDAIDNSPAKVALSEYTLPQVKKAIKDKSMKIYQLGADGQIFFALKKGDPGYAADYGIETPGITNNEVLLTSVINNEPGARGIGGPAVVLKALQEGATVLDAFAVKNAKYPDGFLPSLYAAFGFEKVAEVPFDPQYYSPQKLADAIKFWQDSTPGYNPETDGYPPLVIMKWKGTDADRQNIINRYLRGGLAGLLAGRADGADGSTMRELRDTARAADAEAASADNGGAAGDQGAGAGAPVASRARGTVQGIAALSDNELTNLGLTPEDRAAVQRALGVAPQSDVLNQSQPVLQPKRGTFSPSQLRIDLLKDADLSTFLHETGHFFLEVMADLATQPGAPADVVEDMNALLKWFGVADAQTWMGYTLDEKRPHHEKFAESFEQYLFEGKAPSAELKPLFQRFRQFLTSVYKSLKDFMARYNNDLSDEVRSVFDRMLATDAQIKEAERVAGFAPVFKTKPDFMTDEEWVNYQQQGAEGTEAAIEQLQARSLRDLKWVVNARSKMLSKLQRDINDKRKVVKEEVTAEVRAMPEYAVQRFLKFGELEGNKVEGGKLSLPVLKEMYGEGPAAPWRYIATNMVTKEADTGLHPNMVAELFGFANGDEMVRAIVGAMPEDTTIDGMTDQRLLERYGDLATDKGIERAANEAVHNEARARFVASELRALQDAMNVRVETGKTITATRTAQDGTTTKVQYKQTINAVLAAAKEFAGNLIAQRKVRDLKAGAHTAAESRAALKAERAMAEGDTTGAVTAKRDQLLNHYAAKYTTEALAEVDKKLDYLRKFDKDSVRSKLPPEYMAQIDKLLERVELHRGTSLKEIDKRAKLAEWITAQQELGLDPNIPDYLLEDVQLVSYKNMTLEEFRGLVDTVRNIEHLGRLKDKLLTLQDKRAFAAVIADLEASIRENATSERPVRINAPTKVDKATDAVRGFFSSHRKLSSLIRQFDGMKDGGVFWTVFNRSMNAAGDKEAVMREKATKALSKIFEPIIKGEKLKTMAFIPAINMSLSLETRLAVALNWGNEANRQRVMDGDKWSSAQVEAILSTLTPEQLDFVQKAWDHINTYWPEISAKEERVSGLAPEKVQASAFTVTTADGTVVPMRGGYYPIKYDPDRSGKAEGQTAAELTKQMMLGQMTRATTRRGHTKGRVDTVNRAVRKDLGVIFQHVDQVIHDLAWHEWLIDATRILRAGPIESAIRETAGNEVLREFKRALEDIAAGDVPAQSEFEAAINHLRVGTTIAGMGWNLMTSLMQPLGLTQSIVRVGPKWVGKGLARWIGDATRMENTAKEVYAKSDFMRLRGETMQREINEIRNKVQGEMAGPVKETYFYLIQKAQMIADLPTWLGQYEKSIAAGADEAGAIAQADQAVRDAQGGGQIMDLARVQRGGPLQKLFTNFYSYFSTTYNLTAERYNATSFKDPLQVGRFMVDMLMLYTVPAVVGFAMKEALKGGGEDDDKLIEKLIREQLNYLLGTMVGLRELGASINGFYGYEGPAGTRFFSEVAKLGKQVEQGEVDAPLLKRLNNAAGILFHYPAGQVNRTVEGFNAMYEGKTSNPMALLLGAPKE